MGKSRPRFSRNGTVYTSDRYSCWKSDAILQIRALNLPQVNVPVTVECLFVNFFSSDCDNLLGSVLDALVQSTLLQNDSSSFVVGCSGKFAKVKKNRGQDKLAGVLVRLHEAQIQTIELTIPACK